MELHLTSITLTMSVYLTWIHVLLRVRDYTNIILLHDSLHDLTTIALWQQLIIVDLKPTT